MWLFIYDNLVILSLLFVYKYMYMCVYILCECMWNLPANRYKYIHTHTNRKKYQTWNMFEYLIRCCYALHHQPQLQPHTYCSASPHSFSRYSTIHSTQHTLYTWCINRNILAKRTTDSLTANKRYLLVHTKWRCAHAPAYRTHRQFT